MIPFARILNYGNTAAPAKIIKVQMDTGGFRPSLVALKSDGTLYGTGDNGSNKFLNASSELTTWNLIHSGVKDFWSYYGGILILTYSKQFLYCGSKFPWGSSDSTATNAWVDYTSKFGLVLDDNGIQDIQLSANSVGLLYYNTLYYIGSPNTDYSMGQHTGKTTFTSVLTSIKKFCLGTRSTAILSTANNLYACGWNGYRQFGRPDTYIQTITSVQSNVLDVMITYTSSTIMTTSGSFMSSGNRASGLQGDGGTANYNSVYTNITLPFGTNTNAKLYGSYSNSSGTTNGIILYNGNQFYRTGNNEYSQIGNNSTNNALTFTKALGTSVGTVDSLGSSYNGTLILNNGVLYYYGYNFAASGVSGTTIPVITQVQGP